MSNILRYDKKIWVTQSWPRGHETAKTFETLGVQAVSSPLLIIKATPQEIPQPQKSTHLIFTSQNGVSAFVNKHDSRDYSVTCVGEATADLARAVGFTAVASAKGRAEDVIKHIKQTISKTIPLLHCAGRHVRGRIVETLRDEGYNATRAEYYVSDPVKELPVTLTDFDYVALYSPLGAETFFKCVRNQNVSHLISLSISSEADEALSDLRLRRRLIVERPNQDAMMATLKLDLDTI